MSSAVSIAAVTAVLKRLVEEATFDLTRELGQEVAVTAVPPDQAIGDGGGGPGLNIFMYRVSKNPGWANVDLPELDHLGRRVSNPPLALDLHYILTAVGSADFHSDILLGYGMQALHEYRILPRALIDHKLGDLAPGDALASIFSALAGSGLSEQVEQVKISPDFLELDEISKVWSSVQAKYRPSAYYTASVVLIETERTLPVPQPVAEVSVRVDQFEDEVPGQPADPLVED